MHRFSSEQSPRISKVAAIASVLLLSILAFGCTGAQTNAPSNAGGTTEETPEAQTTDEAASGGVESGEAGSAGGSQNSNASGEAGIANSPSDKVTLRLDGDEGVEFGGSCTVGGERERLSGNVPQTFDYETGGDPVECVIRKRGGAGMLEVVMESGGSRSVQQTNSAGGEIRIGISGGMFSSTSTSSGSSSTSTVTSSQSSSSVTVTRSGD